MSNKNTEQIAGKEIKLHNYLQSLEPTANGQFEAPIKVDDYTQLGYLINSIIGVCRTALYCIEDNANLPPIEQTHTLGASTLDVANVLRIAQNLLPLSEFEGLDKLREIYESE